MTNDGNAILREVSEKEILISFVNLVGYSFNQIQIQVQHPAAKSMIEISRTQDEEVGDGTTSVIILGMSSPWNSFQLLDHLDFSRRSFVHR